MSQKKGKTDEDCGYVDLSERIRNYQKDINRSRKKKPKDEDLILSLTCREHRVLKQRLLQPYLSGTWEREFEFKWINTGGLLSDRFEDHVLGDQEKVCAMALCFVLQRILDFCRDGSFFARELLERLSLIIATSEMENFSMSLSPTSLLRFIKLYHGYMFEEIGRQTAWLFPELNPLQTATAVMVTAMSVSSYMLESAVPPIVLSEFKKADDERTQESRRFKDFGNNAFFKKDYSKALYRYTEAIELNPFNHIVYGNRAQVYIEMEKYSSARSDCFRAMLLDETWPKAYYKDADALEKMGRLEYACATLHAAIKNCSPVYPMADLKEINQKLAKVQQALLDKVVTPRKCVADDVEPRSVENDRSVSPPQRGAGDGSNIVVDGLPGSNESCLEGTGAVSKSCIEGAGAVSKSCVEGASAGNDIVIEGAGEGNENVIEDTSEENDIVVDGVGEGNDIVVEGTGAGSDVVEGECLPKMVSPPDEEGRTADSSMADGVMDSVSTSQAERADTDMAMHPKMAVADPNMVPDVHDQVGNVVKGHAGARNRQAGEKDGASGARPRAVKHESVQTEVRRLRNQQTQCGGEAAASKQLSSLQLQQTQNRKLREQRDEYKEKFRLASESLSKSLTEHDKLKRSFSMTGSSVSKMSVELEEIREYREVRQAEYNSVSDERLKERQRHTAEISDMTAALHGAAEQLSATRETMAAVQQELRAKNLLLEERKAALQVEKYERTSERTSAYSRNKSEQTTGMLRDSQMKMRQVGERAQQAAVSFATATRESSLMALSMAGATYECSIRSHEETLASLKKRAIPYSMLQRIEQVNAECKQVVNSIHSQMTKVQHDFDQHMAALRIGCPLDNLPPMYLAALPGPPPQLCIPWDSVLPACPASTACPPATSGSTTLPAAGVLLPVSSIACTDGAKAAHAQQEIGGATAARAQPQIGGATTARAQPQVAGAKVAHAQQEIGGATAVHAQQEIGGATAARAQPQIGGATAAPIRSEDCGAASVNVRPQTVGGATSGKAQAKPKNNFEKLMLQLLKSFPRQLKSALTKLIQEVRNERGGTLSGMPIDTIVDKIREKVAKQTEMQRQSPAWNVPPKNLQKSQFTEQEDEEPCVICHEEIKISSSLKLKCGHKYHTECIKRWLKKQSTCPTCRVHVLIPDEFPELSRS